MQKITSTTSGPAAPVGTLWVDREHHHRLVAVIRILDQDLVRLQPIRDARLHPPSYLESTLRLAGSDYERVIR
ncbi:MAG: hypothetical protein ACR2ND_15625 [Solirubrobacteraceae bacterium]